MKFVLAAIFFGVTPLVAMAQEVKDEAKASVSIPADKRTPAEIRADQLDKLFGVLQSKDAEDVAKRTEENIWSLWSKSDSPTADLLLSQGSAAMGDDEFDAAEQMINHLIETSPDYAESYYVRASLYFRMRRYAKCMADLDKVLELEPRHFGALSGRGLVFYEQDKREDALAAFEEALAVNPYMEAIVAAVKSLKAERPEL